MSAHLSRRPAAFTLVEMMVSMAILSLLVIVLASITSQTSRTWRYTSGKIEEFREARSAFEIMTTRIAQATLNTYWDYDYDQSTPPKPVRYVRRSELRFLSGPCSTVLPNSGAAVHPGHAIFFHAPLGFVDDTDKAAASYHGLGNLLNVWGYFVEYGDDKKSRPPLLDNVRPPIGYRYRYRLKEFMQPSDELKTYSFTAPSGMSAASVPLADKNIGSVWYANAGTADTHNLAENIVALLLVPKLSQQDIDDLKSYGVTGQAAELAPNYTYDTSQVLGQSKYVNSKNQLPPVVQVTMVAMAEESAVRLRLGSGGDVDLNTLMQTKFQVLDKYQDDLALNSSGSPNSSLENLLVAKHVNYRIFTTDVVIRGAKWSREQADTR